MRPFEKIKMNAWHTKYMRRFSGLMPRKLSINSARENYCIPLKLRQETML